MNDSLFKDAIFDEGWEIKTTITLWEKPCEIMVSASADYEEDGITPEQETSAKMFFQEKVDSIKEIETLLEQHFSKSDKYQLCERLRPREFVIWDNGNCALLLDDAEVPDNGIAVSLLPDKQVWTQDEYLTNNY